MMPSRAGPPRAPGQAPEASGHALLQAWPLDSRDPPSSSRRGAVRPLSTVTTAAPSQRLFVRE